MTSLFHHFAAVANQLWSKPALLHGDIITSFADLLVQADAIALQLSEIGVGNGRPLIVSKTNGADAAAAVVATWKLSSQPVFVSPNAPLSHLAHAVTISHAACVLTDDGLVRTENVRTPQNELTPSIGSVVFTSGSTGTPKGVMQTQANLLDGAQRIKRLLEIGETDSICCPVPWSHDYGWGQLLSCLLCGIPLILPKNSAVQGISDAIETHKPTILAGTPAIFAGMCFGISNIRDANLDSVNKVTSTGARLAPELLSELHKLLPLAAVYANYGMTETYRTCCLLPKERLGREASVGRPIAGCHLTIVDNDGQTVPALTKGEVIHHGTGVFAGYLSEPEKTTATRIAPDQVKTGDVGYLDNDGFLFLVGRKDRLIKSMDVQVSLDEVEAQLSVCGLARQIAVTSFEHQILGQRIEAYVVLIDRESQKDFKAFARKALSKYQLPRVFHFVEAIPQTTSGKINYPALCHV